MPFLPRPPRQGVLIFVFLFIGTICASSVIPVIGFFIVTGLGEPPWKIGLYTAFAAPLTLFCNRRAGEWLDAGVPVRPLLLAAILSFLMFCALMLMGPNLTVLVFAGGLFMSVANTALATSFTYGRLYAQRNGLDVTKTNSTLRMATSLAWMIGPALSYSLIGPFGFPAVFMLSGAVGLCWLTFWFFTIPRDFRAPSRERKSRGRDGINWGMTYAALCCLGFILTNALFVAAMPLYLVTEVGLPEFTPGLSFSVKCLIEVAAIFTGARLALKTGIRAVLMAAAILSFGAMMLFTQVASVAGVAAVAFLEGIYFGLFAGVAITYVQSYAPDKPGRATAVYMNSLFLGGMIGNISMGLIAESFSYRTVVFVAAVFPLLALLLLALEPLVTRKGT